jgi:anti-sigma B factor antagonist
MKPLAQLDVSREEDALVVRLDGEIDISNAADLRAALDAAVPKTALGLILDLSRASYVDSAGVHLLFGLGANLTRRRQQLRLVVPEDAPVSRVLKLTGVSWTVPHDRTVEDALARLRAEVRPIHGEESWLSAPDGPPW